DLPGQARRLLVDGEGLVGDAVLVEHQAERTEGGGLDRVDAGLEVLGVHLPDEIGSGEDEALVAALERGAAEVVGSEALVLHPGAERAVEHEHALWERGEALGHPSQGTGATADPRPKWLLGAAVRPAPEPHGAVGPRPQL